MPEAAVESLLNSAVWSCFGLFIGFGLGILARDVHEIKRILGTKRKDDFNDNP